MKALGDVAVDQELIPLLVVPLFPDVPVAQGLGLEISHQRVGCCQILHWQETLHGFRRVPRYLQ